MKILLIRVGQVIGFALLTIILLVTALIYIVLIDAIWNNLFVDLPSYLHIPCAVVLTAYCLSIVIQSITQGIELFKLK